MEAAAARERTKGTISISIAMLLWGFGYVSTKLCLREFDPFALMLLRHGSSTIIFLTILRVAGYRLLPRLKQYWKRILPLALLGVVINQIFYLWGLHYTTPSHSSLMYTLMPIVAALFAHFVLGERLGWVRWSGIALAFIGAVWLVSGGTIDFGSETMLGDIITLGAVVSFALFIVMAKPVLAEIGVMQTIGMAYLLSIVFVPPFTVGPALAQDWTKISLIGWLTAIYLIVFGTVLAYFAHQYALKRLPAAQTAAWSYSQPAIAAVSSMLLLGEQLPAAFYIAAAMILAGLLLTQFGGKRTLVIPEPAPEH